MNNDFTLIQTIWGDEDAEIYISRDSTEFKAAARELSDFMNLLNLPADMHNKLVDLTVAQVCAAERNAYSQGFGLGLDYARYEGGDSIGKP